MDRVLPGCGPTKIIRRIALGSGLALAAISLLAAAVSALPGTGFEVAVDFQGDVASPGQPGQEFLRYGATTDATALNIWLAVDTQNAGLPKKPVWPGSCTSGLPDFGCVSGRQPDYFNKVQVAGLCYYFDPHYVGTFNTKTVWLADCSISNPVIDFSFNAQSKGDLQASWVCNELQLRIPFSFFSNQATTAGPGTTMTVLMANAGDIGPAPPPATGNVGSTYDAFPVTGVVGNYTFGAPFPSPDIFGLTAVYSATPTPHVHLDWNEPLGGNVVTGYRIERRMVSPSITGWVQLPSFGPTPAAGLFPAYGPMASPPTEYDDPAPSPGGTYQYRVTVLRCNNPPPNVFIDGNTLTVQAVLPTPPTLTPYFLAGGPGIPSEANTVFTSCTDSHVEFLDTSWSPYMPIQSRSWNFGDSSPPSLLPDPTHTYLTPGVKTVTLTVVDNNSVQKSITRSILVLGDPNCCPTLSPLSDIMVSEGEEIGFTVVATDPEGNTMSYRVISFGDGLPAHDFNSQTGEFFWKTTRGQAGLYPLRASVFQDAILVPASDACASHFEFMVTVMPVLATADSDMDGVADAVDRCPSVPDNAQSDADRDGEGDACDKTPCGVAGTPVSACGDDGEPTSPYNSAGRRDGDRDGVLDVNDNCPVAPNNNQLDMDGDLMGDVCDDDLDGDGMLNTLDNCALKGNRNQSDLDGDGIGDSCEQEAVVGAVASKQIGGQGSAVAQQSNAQMPRMGLGAIAFVVVAGLLIFLAARLKK